MLFSTADFILGFCSLSNVVLLETISQGHPSPVWLAGLCYVLKRVLVSASSRFCLAGVSPCAFACIWQLISRGLLMQDIVVGQECSQHRHSLEVTYPITNGIVQKWDDMQHVWNHTFYEQLQIDPAECKILLTDPPLNPKENRDRLLQTMFEHYGFAAAFIQIQAVLTLYAQGKLEYMPRLGNSKNDMSMPARLS